MNVYSIRSADSVTVIVGGKPFTVANDNPRYVELNEAIEADDFDVVNRILSRSEELAQLLGIFGDVKVFAGHVTFQGRPITNYVVERILALMNQGRNPEPYANFLNRVMHNPSKRAIEGLFAWVEKAGLPISPDGRIIAYKRVKADFTDCRTGTMDNSPGSRPSMPRSEVDDDPNQECSSGLHFCSAEYLRHFSGQKTVLVAVDPADVVAFPKDYNRTKGRAWTYEVLFEIDNKTPEKFFDGKDQLVLDPVEFYRTQESTHVLIWDLERLAYWLEPDEGYTSDRWTAHPWPIKDARDRQAFNDLQLIPVDPVVHAARQEGYFPRDDED